MAHTAFFEGRRPPGSPFSFANFLADSFEWTSVPVSRDKTSCFKWGQGNLLRFYLELDLTQRLGPVALRPGKTIVIEESIVLWNKTGYVM